jgi:hypothetical protein
VWNPHPHYTRFMHETAAAAHPRMSARPGCSASIAGINARNARHNAEHRADRGEMELARQWNLRRKERRELKEKEEELRCGGRHAMTLLV